MNRKAYLTGIVMTAALSVVACGSKNLNTADETVPTESAAESEANDGGTEIAGAAAAANAEDAAKSNEAVTIEIRTAETTAAETTASEEIRSKNGYVDGAQVGLDAVWEYAEFSAIHSGSATMYLAKENRKNRIIGVNAGHGTSGGTDVKTWCHPDKTAKVTGGTTSAGATQAVAVSTGMNFSDGTPESTITLKAAQMLRDRLLARGFDVLMIRDGDDVQLDNVARTVICNNAADCHIALHWDGDGLDYDKGCFYMSVPDGIKYLDSVVNTWQSSEALGSSLIDGLQGQGCKIFGDGTMDMDLTQTAYSTVPSIDIELGNQSSDHSDAVLQTLALGLADGVELFWG